MWVCGRERDERTGPMMEGFVRGVGECGGVWERWKRVEKDGEVERAGEGLVEGVRRGVWNGVGRRGRSWGWRRCLGVMGVTVKEKQGEYRMRGRFTDTDKEKGRGPKTPPEMALGKSAKPI